MLQCGLIYEGDEMVHYKLGKKPYRPRTKVNADKWRAVRVELRTARDVCPQETMMEVGGEEFIYYLTGRGSLIKIQ